MATASAVEARGGGGRGVGSGSGVSTGEGEGIANVSAVGAAAAAVGAEKWAMAKPGLVVRRDLLVECRVGYFGDCERCSCLSSSGMHVYSSTFLLPLFLSRCKFAPHLVLSLVVGNI